MTILDKINANKLKEIEAAKASISVKKLEGSPLFERDCFSLKDAIIEKSGIIAEFKSDVGGLRNEIETAGSTFLHAPLFHPARRVVGPLRKGLVL